MPGLPLEGTPFRDLLPDSISGDPTIRAAADTLDALLYCGDIEVENALIWARIDSAKEPLLSNLAYQLHLEGYEGWQLAETLEQKRAMVKDAVKLHFYKGTRFTLERIFELLEMRGTLIEWWEDRKDPDFPPYTFDIDVDVSRPISETFYFDVLNLVDTLKNKRSHRRKLRVFLTTRGKQPLLGAATVCGNEVTVWPFGVTDVQLRAELPTIAAGSQITHTYDLYPFER